jgi:hypothetical protein
MLEKIGKEFCVKANVKLSQCLTKHHSMKTYGRVAVLLHTLTSALVGGELTDKRKLPNICLKYYEKGTKVRGLLKNEALTGSEG